MNGFKGIHWSLMPNADEIRKKISENRRGKSIGNSNGFKKGKPSWNKGLPKDKQPRYGKPVSIKQIEHMRKVGRLPTKAWNKGLKEWSPRLSVLQSARALARDAFKCTKCGDEKLLVVHHIVCWKEMEDKTKINDLDNLITLCRRCHLKIHNYQKKLKL